MKHWKSLELEWMPQCRSQYPNTREWVLWHTLRWQRERQGETQTDSSCWSSFSRAFTQSWHSGWSIRVDEEALSNSIEATSTTDRARESSNLKDAREIRVEHDGKTTVVGGNGKRGANFCSSPLLNGGPTKYTGQMWSDDSKHKNTTHLLWTTQSVAYNTGIWNPQQHHRQ